MIREVLSNFALQTVSTIGAIFLFGWLIALCNRRFYANFGSESRVICYATGFLGTPVHELSHALFCLIFGHKILEIKLFCLNSDDGTLGYVRHAYNKKNFYQRIGNFFIGVAPVLGISAVMYLVSYFLLPSFTSQMNVFADGISSGGFGEIMNGLKKSVSVFFSLVVTWEWWVFLLIGIFLTPHMTLSGADMKSAMSGLVFALVAVFVLDVCFAVIGGGLLENFTGGVVRLSGFLIVFLAMALLISLVALGISYAYKKIRARR